MNQWLDRGKRGLLAVVQILLLSVIQLFGFIAAAQWNGLVARDDPNPRTTVAVGEDDTHKNPSSDATEEHAQEVTEATATERARHKQQQQQLKMLMLLAMVCVLNAVALVCWLKTTVLAGWRLSATCFIAFFMCMTVMPQSDTLFYLRDPWPLIRLAGRMGFAVSGCLAVAVVPTLWRWRHPVVTSVPTNLPLKTDTIALRTFISVVAYVALYLLFGYFVAWQDADVRALYGGGAEAMGFWRHIATPPVPNRVVPFQLVRGLAWTLLCLFMIRVSYGHRLRVAVTIGLFLAVIMNAQLLLPNPVMSAKVRHLHLAETAVSTFLFGVFCVCLWTRPRTSI